jgi:hypothetical protein
MFKEHGYVVLPNLLGSLEVKNLAENIHKLHPNNLKKPIKWNIKDGVSRYKIFWWLISHKDLIESIKEILCCSNICYLENSSIKAWYKQKASGWHRDSVDIEFGRGDD